ncbi:MAG: helical backbone metal receptor [Phycisphaerae bacterium]
MTIAPNSEEIICALGACERIVGVSKFCVFPEELGSRPSVGGLFDPNLERIVSLRPDLVVLRGRSNPIENLCSQLGVPLYLDETDTLSGITTCIVELGEKLDRQARARALAADFQRRLSAIRHRVAGRPRPRVLLTVSRQPDKLANILTAGAGTFLDEMLDVAGGVNIFGQIDMPYPQVSVEGIVAQRPEVIIELMPELNATGDAAQEVLAVWSRVGSIPAAKSGRVFLITERNCLIPSPRYVETIEKVSRLLHPEPNVGQ